ncbi:MAG: phosphoribosylamine--glycine ligase [bacterium]
MKVLLVGSGGREHALAWRLATSPSVTQVIVPNANPGIAEIASTPALPSLEPAVLAEFAKAQRIDLTVVGPEAPLVHGIADEFRRANLPIFGHTRDAARIEGSKAFAKRIMARGGIPTARHDTFEIPEMALAHVRSHKPPYVLKADGLAAGKGVVIAQSRDEAEAAIRDWMIEGKLGAAGKRLVIEEFLEGAESSFIAIVSGERFVSFREARDYKRAYDGDRGPNTGGMGVVAPVAGDLARRSEIEEKVIARAAWAMKKEGCPLSGVLFAGLIWTGDGAKVLEFNCRFGDPETQALLPLFEGDLGLLLHGGAVGELDERPLRFSNAHAVTVVVAAEGYPESPRAGDPIDGLSEAAAVAGVHVFHAGTRRDGERIVTSGGRVAAVTGVAPDHEAARRRAYDGASRIRFRGAWSRNDIGEESSS